MACQEINGTKTTGWLDVSLCHAVAYFTTLEAKIFYALSVNAKGHPSLNRVWLCRMRQCFINAGKAAAFGGIPPPGKARGVSKDGNDSSTTE